MIAQPALLQALQSLKTRFTRVPTRLDGDLGDTIISTRPTTRPAARTTIHTTVRSYRPLGRGTSMPARNRHPGANPARPKVLRYTDASTSNTSSSTTPTRPAYSSTPTNSRSSTSTIREQPSSNAVSSNISTVAVGIPSSPTTGPQSGIEGSDTSVQKGTSAGTDSPIEPRPRKLDSPHGYKAAKPPLTHFLSIPLYDTQGKHNSRLARSLSRFRDLMPTLYPETSSLSPTTNPTTHTTTNPTAAALQHPDFWRASIRGVGTLHLTLGVMSLTSLERISRAVELLESLDLAPLLYPLSTEDQPQSQVSPTPELGKTVRGEAGGGQIRVHLRGVESMHSPSSTTVLYVSPHDPTNRLRRLCEAVRAAFADEGLVVDEGRDLKLHATVLNTLYASSLSPSPSQASSAAGRDGAAVAGRGGQGGRTGRGGRARARAAPVRLDARPVLDKFKEFDWLDPDGVLEEAERESGLVLGKIAICNMGAIKAPQQQREPGHREEGAGKVKEDEHYAEVASRSLLHG